MNIIFLIIGFALGCITVLLIKSRCKIYGVIEVDHNTRQCRFRITSDELSDRRNTKAVFDIKHDVMVSQKEQGL